MQTAVTKPNSERLTSSPMPELASYVAGALGRALPARVVEKTKHHLLDTIAAMVSGSPLLPGRSAISYARTLGGTRESSVIAAGFMTTAQQASGVSCWARAPEHVEKAFDFGGMPARNGVAAASMVAAGLTGVDDVFSGERNFLIAYAAKPDP